MPTTWRANSEYKASETPSVPKRFADFAQEQLPLDGSKVKIEEVLNREITVLACKIRTSKYDKSNSPRCLTLQFELDGQRHVLFSGSSVLIEQTEKYQAEMPFLTVIKKIDKYYTFS